VAQQEEEQEEDRAQRRMIPRMLRLPWPVGEQEEDRGLRMTRMMLRLVHREEEDRAQRRMIPRMLRLPWPVGEQEEVRAPRMTRMMLRLVHREEEDPPLMMRTRVVVVGQVCFPCRSAMIKQLHDRWGTSRKCGVFCSYLPNCQL
jgi:hypothetical protein